MFAAVALTAPAGPAPAPILDPPATPPAIGEPRAITPVDDDGEPERAPDEFDEDYTAAADIEHTAAASTAAREALLHQPPAPPQIDRRPDTFHFWTSPAGVFFDCDGERFLMPGGGRDELEAINARIIALTHPKFAAPPAGSC